MASKRGFAFHQTGLSGLNDKSHGPKTKETSVSSLFSENRMIFSDPIRKSLLSLLKIQ